jgi:hypothetical protein
MVRHKGVERAGRQIGHWPHPASADSSWISYFYRNADKDLLAVGATACQPGLMASDIRLIHFHRTG